MATIFVSYKFEDRPLAERFGEELGRLGHRVVYDKVLRTAGQAFRTALTEQLVRADAVVVLLTQRALSSQFVMGEVGAARALGHSAGQPLLIPVVVGSIDIPEAVDDLTVVRMKDEDRDLRTAADEVARGLGAYLEGAHGSRRRIFISHRHEDAPVVKALVRLIEAAFDVTATDIRCTSLQPYTLRAGERTADRLREEIRHAEAVLGIVTPDMKASSYVLFELGASWGRKGMTFPLLARGATAADVPAPIGDLHTLALTDAAECHQLVQDLGEVTTLDPRGNAAGAVAERVVDLVAAALPAR